MVTMYWPGRYFLQTNSLERNVFFLFIKKAGRINKTSLYIQFYHRQYDYYGLPCSFAEKLHCVFSLVHTDIVQDESPAIRHFIIVLYYFYARKIGEAHHACVSVRKKNVLGASLCYFPLHARQVLNNIFPSNLKGFSRRSLT